MLAKKIINAIALGLVTFILLFSSASATSPDNSEFEAIEQILASYGFTVELAIPPYQNRFGIRPYGAVNNQDNKVWINPIVFDLGNAVPTIVHEAVHVAQLCKGGKSSFQLINLDIAPPKITHPYFTRYHSYQREIEAEAYTVQVQPNKTELAKELLAKHCLPESE